MSDYTETINSPIFITICMMTAMLALIFDQINFLLQLIELKNGETYNGHLAQCDSWMNMHLREVICTSKDGDRFWRMPEAYVRGNTIKYLRIPDDILEKARENDLRREERRALGGGRGRGPRGRGGRGEGRGGPPRPQQQQQQHSE